jgi:hypothetical protein
MLTHTPSKNKVMGVALALGGHRFIQHQNQPKSWQSGRGDARVEAKGGGGVWGDAIQLFGLANQLMEKYQKYKLPL